MNRWMNWMNELTEQEVWKGMPKELNWMKNWTNKQMSKK